MKSASELQVEEWLLKLAIHQPVEIVGSANAVVKSILTYAATVDMYCPACAKPSTFKGHISSETEKIAQSEKFAASGFNTSSSFWAHTIFSKQLLCTRAAHEATFYFHIDDGKLFKVGQYPSLANINFGDSLKYLNALGVDHLRELHQAISLAANGVGVGAMVYFKRVFAYFMQDALQQAQRQTDWQAQHFQEADFAAKLNLLENYLPQFVLQHPEACAILGEDMTTLTDAQCLTKANAVQAMILLLADEKLAQMTRVEGEAAVMKSLNA